MPNMKVVDMAGKEVGTMELSEKVFGAEIKESVLHAAVRAYLMNQRQGTQSTLTRAEVSGGGKSRGARREQAMQDRARQGLRSGRTAAWRLVRSRAPIA